jgi:DNA-binding winged helix-turn-helix (wHTH) protein
MEDGWLRFGRYYLDPGSADLFGPAGPVEIQPLPARLLAYLVERPGRVVERRELQVAIWERATSSTDQALNTAIRQVRLALDDSADEPVYVATVPRRGYRFIAEVTTSPGPAPASIGTPAAEPARRPRGPSIRLVPSLLVVAAIGIVAIVAAATAGWGGPGSRTATSAGDLPDELRMEYEKARTLLRSEDTVKLRTAARAFETVRHGRPEFVPAVAGAGHAALLLGENERAAGLAAWSLAADSSSGEGHLVLGLTLLNRGAWDEAEAHLERARALEPGLVGAHTGLATLAARAGRLDEAFEHARSSVHADPVSAVTLGDAGYVALWTGRYDVALDWCGDAMDVRPDWLVPRYCRLDAYHALGRRAEERDAALDILRRLEADTAMVDSLAALSAEAALSGYRAWQIGRLENLPIDRSRVAAGLAVLHAQDGDLDAARRLLDEIAEDTPERLPLLLLDPALASLRDGIGGRR